MGHRGLDSADGAGDTEGESGVEARSVRSRLAAYDLTEHVIPDVVVLGHIIYAALITPVGPGAPRFPLTGPEIIYIFDQIH